MTIATLLLNNEIGKYQLVFNNEIVCESAWPHTIKQKVKTGFYRASHGIESIAEPGKRSRGVSSTSIIDGTTSTDPLSKFSVDERFQMLHDTALDVALGNKTGAVVTGEGGLGKSHTVLAAMKEAGLVDARPFLELLEVKDSLDDLSEALGEDDAEEEQADIQLPDNVFIQLKGYTTARGLYETLYKYNGRCIIMDDCDKALFDATACGILKGALDTTSERWINWSTGKGNKNAPKTFMFTGSIIFITNKNSEDVDQAIRTRVYACNMYLSAEQKIERMKTIAFSDAFMNNVSDEVKTECLDLIDELKDTLLDLSMRTLIKAIKERTQGRAQATGRSWKRAFEFSECC